MTLRMAALIAWSAGLAFGQVVPKFEVASIRVCKAGDVVTARGQKKGGGGRVSGSPGRMDAECQTVDRLIRDAYLLFGEGKPWPVSSTTGLPNPPVSNREMNQEIKGAPGWISSERYTVNAKTEGAQSNAMMRAPMMQALLEDRFHLKIHREAVDVPVYELTVAKGGAKVQPARKGGCVPIDFEHPPEPGRGPGPEQVLCGMLRISETKSSLDMVGSSMADFCRQFSEFVGQEIVDRTGMTGAFDFHLDLAPGDLGMIRVRPGDADPPAPPPDPADIFVAVKGAVQKVGLKLESGKASGKVLVIDHIERPTEN